MSSLGERIRKLRKEKKMTLVDVAGEAMSKGMLSLIENGRSNPSMESLQHIAKQLGVNVQVLLTEESSEEMKKKLVEIEEEIRKAYNAVSLEEYERLNKAIQNELEETLKRDLPKTYETARLRELAGRIYQNRQQIEKGMEYLQIAMNDYQALGLNHNVYKVQLRMVMEHFRAHKYEYALEQLIAYKYEYEKKELLADPLVQIESDHLEAALLSAVGKYTEAENLLEEIISFSKRKNIYYLMDDIYRLASFHALLNGDEEKRQYTLKKSRQFAEFTEHHDGLYSSIFVEIHYRNFYLKKHEEALKMTEELKKAEQFSATEDGGYFHLECGSALYGLGKYEEAYEELIQFKDTGFAHHPFDLSMMATADAYLALCLIEKGDPEAALASAEKAKAAVADLPETPYRHFIQETWEKTIELMSDKL
ncbi:helix-turn-helix domain-containing protein [Jeotgalibacillus salarius]|uniref:XRE family transcriptional regulator n=1 Tax=Jeotgalibacillus salarius TaxID=546023 RepID=A0A4Y8LG44_9BACL|nr:helix-turn-helix transcriptional regulator [Jeotgalibacillus salarius]TFE01732.1 XRE family transcriptional regulator [Jeotgalibacillus salarius]